MRTAAAATVHGEIVHYCWVVDGGVVIIELSACELKARVILELGY
jgi:hypothetical protein